MLRSLLAALVCSAALDGAQARVYSGSVSGAQFPFVAKFAFGMDTSGGVVGSAVVSYSNMPSSESQVRGAVAWARA